MKKYLILFAALAIVALGCTNKQRGTDQIDEIENSDPFGIKDVRPFESDTSKTTDSTDVSSQKDSLNK